MNAAHGSRRTSEPKIRAATGRAGVLAAAAVLATGALLVGQARAAPTDADRGTSTYFGWRRAPGAPGVAAERVAGPRPAHTPTGDSGAGIGAPENLDRVALELVLTTGVPPAAASPDTCTHCHLTGENTNPVVPPARWALFGTAFAAFAFGMYRSAVVWRNRSPWRPLTDRAADWLEGRYGLAEPLSELLAKPVPRYAQHWWYCLGGITAFLFITQAVTGVLLAFYYEPTPDAAYASIQFIESQVRYGAAVRAIHHWAANGMVVLCIAHMIRVFVMGAYKPPRELTWVSGVLLLVLTMMFGFTGYLLPWDQRAYWATTVGSEIAGSIPVIGDLALVMLRVGWDITGLTLSRFFALHVLVLPACTIATMGAHFVMIRRQGVAQPL